MNSLKLSAVLVSVAALGTAALADSAVGTWKGHLDVKIPAQAANMPPQAQAQMKAQLDMVKKMVFLLKLNANKTFTMEVQGAPAFAGKQDNKETGTWTQTGNSVTLKGTPKKDKPGSDKPVTLTLSGKTMTLIPPGSAGQGKITFNKA